MPDDQQITTITNDPYEDLEPIYQDAVNMRIDGFRYAAIAQHCKVKEQTVREWFMKGGRLNYAFKHQSALRKKESKELQKNVREQINDAVVDAITTLKNKARAGNVVAASVIAKLADLEPAQKVELSQDPTRPVFYIPDNARDTKDNKTTT